MLSRGLLQRRLRQIHFALAAVIGAQVFLWLASGLFMVAFDIDAVRGDHLRGAGDVRALPLGEPFIAPEIAIAQAPFLADSATLRMLHGSPVWVVEGGGQRSLVGAASGKPWPAPTADDIEWIATETYAGRGTLQELVFLDEAPLYAGASGPIWQARFGPEDKAELFLDPITGEPGKIRTPLWHAFDFAWGLHIMDWSSRDNFNSWWIRATAFFGFLFAVSGLGLIATRAARFLSGRRAHPSS